jgi:acyl-coenzyme A synthetase/AMP-(fatty) acid ligase
MGDSLPEACPPAVAELARPFQMPDDPRQVGFDWLVSGEGTFAPVVIDPAADPAVLQYTDGTTDVPKAPRYPPNSERAGGIAR